MRSVLPSDWGFPQVTVVLYIALFGALGCLARYFLSGWVYDLIGSTLPYGTLAVNVIGAFLIGLVMEFSLRSAVVSPDVRTGLTIGFLGGFTTFSSFSYETFRLLEGAQLPHALANVLLSVTACLAFTFLGIVAARHM
jgi:CrcB protein